MAQIIMNRRTFMLSALALVVGGCKKVPGKREAAARYLREVCGISHPTREQITAAMRDINVKPRPFSGVLGSDVNGKCPEITRVVVKENECPKTEPAIARPAAPDTAIDATTVGFYKEEIIQAMKYKGNEKLKSNKELFNELKNALKRLKEQTTKTGYRSAAENIIQLNEKIDNYLNLKKVNGGRPGMKHNGMKPEDMGPVQVKMGMQG